ncbi:MAG: tRNA 2-thiouridine(34) synthase MnmA [Spirochaetales bacterium]|nr:tRNA 2-thiouridine(34) synthase MnmA [Spirochaetales bacterium]
MKIAVLLSGGVDSSVALHLLREQGQSDIEAFYLKIWLEDEVRFLGDCPWEEDLKYARTVSEMAGVGLSVISLQREYYNQVVSYALAELKKGRTPSPDIFCNHRIKFGLFQNRIDPSVGKIASGHYAVLKRHAGRYLLARSPDPVKDQTYFLSHQNQGQLSRSLFPIGHLTKKDVRDLARKYKLPNKDRKDSQGICFLGKIRYPDFVRHYLGEKPGDIVDRETGRILGTHNGYWFHTIGQRQGLGLGNGPWYVSGKDVEANRILVTHGTRGNLAETKAFTVGDLHWISDPPEHTRLHIKIRHGPALIPSRVSHIDSGRMGVEMDFPDRGVAPGQFAVFYSGEICLGAGVIETRHRRER